MKKSAKIYLGAFAWILITILFNTGLRHIPFLSASHLGGYLKLRAIRFAINIVWIIVWMVVLYFVVRNEPELKRGYLNIVTRMAIFFAYLIAFILGHVLSVVVGATHYIPIGVYALFLYGTTYLIAFIVGIRYVLVKTHYLGWKVTLRNGLISSIILGFIIMTILGIPISQ